MMGDNGDLAVIYNKLHEMISHMEEQASVGKKFMPNSQPNSASAPYKLYVNDFFVGDNTLRAKAGDRH